MVANIKTHSCTTHQDIILNIIKNTQITLQKDLEQAIKNLTFIAHKTLASLYATTQIINPINNVFLHHYEFKNILKEIHKLSFYQKHSAYLLISGKGLFWAGGHHTILSLGYSMIMQKYMLSQDINAFFKIQKLKIQTQQQTQPQHSTDGLTTHKTNNYAPICCCPDNPLLPVFEPKTIIDFINLKRLLKTEKNKQQLLSDLNYVANLTDNQRGQYLESLILAKNITAEDCKRHALSKILIGQKGIFAVKDIPAFTVLGYYSGLYFTEKERYKRYKKETGEAGVTYAFSLPDVDMPRISGFMYGNDLTCINAGTTYIGSIKKIAREIFENCSVSTVYAKSLEYPDKSFVADDEKYDLVSYVTNRLIKKGEQLLINYGRDYWDYRLDNVTVSDDDDDKIFDLVMSYRLKESKNINKKYYSKIK
jgi:hypothetical protein